jgi:hypothetical protein
MRRPQSLRETSLARVSNRCYHVVEVKDRCAYSILTLLELAGGAGNSTGGTILSPDRWVKANPSELARRKTRVLGLMFVFEPHP